MRVTVFGKQSMFLYELNFRGVLKLALNYQKPSYRFIRIEIPIPRECVRVIPEYPPLVTLTPFMFIPPV